MTTTTAIVIGVSEYQDPELQKIPGAEADALLFARSLHNWGIEESNIHLFLNEEATEETLRLCFEKLQGIKEPFKLVFYYCGHGFRSAPPEPKSYLLFSHFAVELEEILAEIYRLNARENYLFIDACHLRLNSLVNPKLEREPQSLFCLLSSGIEKSYEDVGGEYGYFTSSLIKNLSLLRQGENRLATFVETIYEELRQKELPLPEMYNIETHRLDFLPPILAGPGRKELIAKIQDLLVSSPQKMLCLFGEEGIGKTTVSKQLAVEKYRSYYFEEIPSLERLPRYSLAILDQSLTPEFHDLIEVAKRKKIQLIFTGPNSLQDSLLSRYVTEFKIPPLTFEEAKLLLDPIESDSSLQRFVFFASKGNPQSIKMILRASSFKEIDLDSVKEAIGAIAACGMFLNEALFCSVFQLKQETLSLIEKMGFTSHSKEGWIPEESLFNFAESENLPLDPEKAIRYWCQQIDEAPAELQPAKSLLLTLKCFGYREEIDPYLTLAFKTLRYEENASLFLDDGLEILLSCKNLSRSAQLLREIFQERGEEEKGEALLQIAQPPMARKKRASRLKLAFFVAISLLLSLFFIFSPDSETFVSLPSSYSNFVDREEILKALQHKLKQTPVIVLYGPGGIGKSETAIRFGNDHIKDFSLIYWINAGSEEVYQQSYYNLAQHLNVPFNQKMPFEKVREKVNDVLEHRKFRKPWLLIFDNADQRIELPKRGRGKILITSRDKTPWESTACMEMPLFSEKGAKKLFEKVMQGEDSVEEWLPLAKELDYFPLALDQALHYVKKSPTLTLANYRTLLGEKKLEILKYTKSTSRYGNNLLAVWQTSNANLQSKNPNAYEWLEVCAYLHPDKLPMEWVETWVMQQKNVPESVAVLEANEILHTLESGGYISLNKKTNFFSIHRLKQKFIQQTSAAGAEKAFVFLAKQVKDFEYHDTLEISENIWQKLSIWEASALWLLKEATSEQPESEELALILQVLGNCNIIIKGKHKEGLEFFKQAQVLLHKLYQKEEHPSVIINWLNQAYSLFLQGYYNQAEETFKYALTIARRLYQDKPAAVTAHCLSGLTMVFDWGNQLYAALKVCEEALAMRKALCGLKPNGEVCESIKWMGAIWIGLGDYQKALTLSFEALELNQRIFGEKPNIQRYNILSNLGIIHLKLDDLDSSLHYYLQALSIHEKVCSNEFSAPLSTFVKIATIYRLKKDYKKSLFYLQKALIIIENIFANHPNLDCLDAWRVLGDLYRDREELPKSLQYYKFALEKAAEMKLDKSNLSYFFIYRGLGKAYSKLGEIEKGIGYWEDAIRIFTSNQENLHPDLIPVLTDLRDAYRKGENLQKADECSSWIEKIRAAKAKDSQIEK